MTDARTPNGDAAAQAEDAAGQPKKLRKYYIGDGEVNIWRQNMEIRNPMKDGLGKLPMRMPWTTIYQSLNKTLV